MMIFIPHEEIPQHYAVHPDWVIRTQDSEAGYFRWSRMLSNNYIEGQGFLTHHRNQRMGFQCYVREGDQIGYIEANPQEAERALASLFEEGKETILHYGADGAVDIVILNVPCTTLEQLPSQYKKFYYDNP